MYQHIIQKCRRGFCRVVFRIRFRYSGFYEYMAVYHWSSTGRANDACKCPQVSSDVASIRWWSMLQKSAWTFFVSNFQNLFLLNRIRQLRQMLYLLYGWGTYVVAPCLPILISFSLRRLNLLEKTFFATKRSFLDNKVKFVFFFNMF